MGLVFSQVPRINQDIIDVYYGKPVKEVSEYLIHEVLKKWMDGWMDVR